MSPLKKRPVAIAMTCLIVLIMCLLSRRPVPFEYFVVSIGLIAASMFWLDCIDYAENNHEAD